MPARAKRICFSAGSTTHSPRSSSDGPTFERIDDRADYGELRRIAIGLADGLHLTVVYTDRPGAREMIRRVISARRSNRRERRAYDEAYRQEA